MRRNCLAITLAVVAFATGSALAQIVAQAPGPAVSMTMSDAPLMQSSEAMCRAKLGGTSQTLIMVADPGDFTGTGAICSHPAVLVNNQPAAEEGRQKTGVAYLPDRRQV